MCCFIDCGNKKILTYFFTGVLADISTVDVDIIIFAFAFVDDNGTIYLDKANQDKLDATLPELIKLKSERPELKVLISVGGYYNSDTFPIVAASVEKRGRFATTSTQFMKKYHFDGMDIDWEFKECTDTVHYADLVNDMRKVNPDIVLTVTVFRRPNRMACIDYRDINQAVDYYNLLTYEYYGVWSKITGFNTPLQHVSGEPCYLYIDASTDVFLGLKGVDQSKVMLGLAFYGQQFGDTDGLHAPFDKDISHPIDFKDISDVTSAKYDSVAAAVYIHDETNRVLTTFDDVRSIAAKCNYIISKGVAGAVVWELGEDKNGELLDSVISTLKSNSGMFFTCMH